MANFIDSFRAGGIGKGGYNFQSRNTSEVPVILQLITGQVANALEVKNALGATIFSVSPVGNVSYTGSETVTDAITATGAITGGSLSISGLSTLGNLIVNGSATLNSGLTVVGNSSFGDTTTIHALTVQGDLQLESGYIRSKYSANLHLLPAPSTITIVGDAGTTSNSLNTNDDLLVTGKLEVDGTAYFDNGFTSSGGTIYGALTRKETSSSLHSHVEDYNDLETVGADYAAIYTLAIPEDTTVQLRAQVVGIDVADSGNNVSKDMELTVVREGAAAPYTLNSIVTLIHNTKTPGWNTNPGAIFDYSGNNLVVNVRSAIGVTVRWSVRISYFLKTLT